MKTVIRHLRRAALLHKSEGLTDSQLLEAFLSRHEEAAFEALLCRHGPMVLGVCLRVLRNVHDAEDAFQATFLVLARKAGSLCSRELLGNWLYGVAYRTAMKARAMNAKRRSKERHAGEMSRSESSADEELLAQLDRELNRLPDRYRVPVVLCELEGRSRKEVARILGVPEGTLSSRLAQAKKLLCRRLSRYGTAAVAALLAESGASACLSPILRTSTAKAVLTAGAVPAKVLALTEGAIKAMFLNKLKITACSAALMLVAGVGVSGLSYRATAQQPVQGVARESQPQTDELEALRLEIEALRKSLQATRERVKTLEEEMRTMKRTEKNSPRTTPSLPDRNRLQGQPPVDAPRDTWPSPQNLNRNRTPVLPPADTVPVRPRAGSASPARTSGAALDTTTVEGNNFAIGPSGGVPASPAAAAPLPPPPSWAAAQSGASVPPGRGAGEWAVPGNPPPVAPAAQTQWGYNFTPSKPPKLKDASLYHAEQALKRLRENPNDTKAVETLERALKQLKKSEKPRPPASQP
jgi:RNA polymerase sigma factor (sigma-70 family)